MIFHASIIVICSFSYVLIARWSPFRVLWKIILRNNNSSITQNCGNKIHQNYPKSITLLELRVRENAHHPFHWKNVNKKCTPSPLYLAKPNPSCQEHPRTCLICVCSWYIRVTCIPLCSCMHFLMPLLIRITCTTLLMHFLMHLPAQVKQY